MALRGFATKKPRLRIFLYFNKSYVNKNIQIVFKSHLEYDREQNTDLWTEDCDFNLKTEENSVLKISYSPYFSVQTIGGTARNLKMLLIFFLIIVCGSFTPGLIFYLGKVNISTLCDIIIATIAVYGVVDVIPKFIVNRRAELAGEILSLLEDYEDKVSHLSILRYRYDCSEWSRKFDKYHKNRFLPASAKSYRLKDEIIINYFTSLQHLVGSLHDNNRFENQIDEATNERFWQKEWKNAGKAYKKDWNKFVETFKLLKEKLLEEALYEKRSSFELFPKITH